MKQLPKLTKASEQRISEALSKVAELLDQGEEPNEAIIKVATDIKLPAGQVRLMVRAFNTGRSLEHLQTHDTLEEKAAAFELADASEVLERMFPSKIKTAAEQRQETAVSSDYSMSPEHWLKRRARSEVTPMTKAAAAPSPYPEYPTRQVKKAFSAINDLRHEADAKRLDAIRCSYAVVATMDKLAAYFHDPLSVGVLTATENAAHLLGQRVHTLMSKVATDAMVSRRLRREQGIKSAFVPTPVDWNAAPYSLIKDALAAVDRFTAAQENMKETEAEYREKRAEMLRPFEDVRPIKPTYGSVWKDGSEKQAVGQFARDTMAMGLANTVADFANRRLGTEADRGEMLQEALGKLADPKHEDKLRAIRQQAMMHEMIASDPVLSGYHYNDVIDAHNRLSELAPRAMSSWVTARAMLRKFLEQGENLDIYDAKQLLDTNESINKRDMPEGMRGYLTGAQRSMGEPMPTRNQKVPEVDPATPLGKDVGKPIQKAYDLLTLGSAPAKAPAAPKAP